MKRYYRNYRQYSLPEWHDLLLLDMRQIEREISNRDLAGEIRMKLWSMLDMSIAITVNGNLYQMEEEKI